MKKILILVFLIFSFTAACSAGAISFNLDSRFYSSPPEPRLRYPIYDTVDINNNEPLEFKWWNDQAGISGFVLRVYRGYKMYADNLIINEKLPANAISFAAKPDLFEDGQVYTWSLVAVSFAGYKSDRSFNSFRVIKQQPTKQ